MTWRLGLDIGTNSIGWAVLSVQGSMGAMQPTGIVASGVRIFSDGRNPKDGQSLAIARRGPRQQRRMRDRYLRRRGHFMEALIRHALMPDDAGDRKELEKEDPWLLRVKALDEKISPYQLGRALFHLQQRRGFKSNRKTDGGGEDEAGKIKLASDAAVTAMEKTGARTFGELLATPRLSNPSEAHCHPVRSRLKGTGAQAHYDYYPTRDLIEKEFMALWEKQKSCHPDVFTDAARSELSDILFFQRPLKPQPVGKCSLDRTEERAPKALPSVQRLRIYQEINHLTVRPPGEAARPITREERDVLVRRALSVKQLTFKAAKKVLDLPESVRFNLESEKRPHLDGDKTAAIVAAAKNWGKGWRDLSPQDQEKVVERLLEEEDETTLVRWLVSEYRLSEEAARAVSRVSLPDGHARLGRTATGKIFACLEGDVISYDKAVVAAGYESHSALDFDGEFFDSLPYYGQVLERHVAFGTSDPGDGPEKRFGKIANPTVHVALNQIRRVVNDLVIRFGPPSQIVVELARDLPLSALGKSELEKSQRDNRRANDERRKVLAAQGQSDSYDNRLRLRLWEELNADDVLDRRCPYTGDQISLSKLFSAEVEIEHILPFSRTLDDGVGNKTLSMRRANRFKGQQTPFEAFASSPQGYDWESISARAANLPRNKSWRFAPDAMDRYTDKEKDFLARQLVDTRYMSRLATLYLKRTGADVWVTPGRFTSDLRWAWGLDSVLAGHNREEGVDPEKNRNDHRHHAVDAIVVALTDRSLLKQVATVAGRAEVKFDKRYLAGINDPWSDFRDTVRDSIRRIVVSHKSDHGVQGALHNDTAYGVIAPPDVKGRSSVVHRVPLESLKPKQLDTIRDHQIRDYLKEKTQGLEGKEFTDVLVAAGQTTFPPVKKVRVVETLSVIPTSKDAKGKILKAYKGDANYCYDIFAGKGGKWTGNVVSRFEANQKGFNPKAKALSDGSPLIMRIRGNDMIAISEDEKPRMLRVVKFSKGQIALADHQEGGPLKARDADKDDSFKYLIASPSKLQKLKARLVSLSPSGKVFDPGPHR